MTDPWPLEKRRDDLRSCIYLMIRSGNDIADINVERLLETFGPDIKPVTARKWWAEERDRFGAETAERATRIPPNSDTGGEGK